MSRSNKQAPQAAPAAPETVTRILARELIQAGELRRAGDTVTLRPDQVEYLEPRGYFEPAPGAGKET